MAGGSRVDFFFFCLCYDVGARKRDNRCRNIGSHTFFMVPLSDFRESFLIDVPPCKACAPLWENLSTELLITCFILTEIAVQFSI